MSGSGYSQNGGRQQRKRPRDFEDDQYRRPRNFDLLERLKRDLVNLCDPGNVATTEDIKYVARKIAIDFETPETQERILDLVRDCVLQLSVKTCHYAAVVSLAGAQNKTFGDAFVAVMARTLELAYEARNWRDVKLIVRLLAYMDRCLARSGTTTIMLLQGLIRKLQEARHDVPTISANEICRIVLLTIPYLVAGSSQVDVVLKQATNSLLDEVRPYIEMRITHLPDSVKAIDSLNILFSQAEQASRAEWVMNYLPQFLEFFGPDGANDAFEMPLVAFGALPNEQGSLESKAYLELFHQQTVKSVPPADDLAASVFRDQVTDVLDLLVANRKDAARFLIDLESYFQPGIFVLRGTPLDKIPADGPTWKAEDIVVEGIFSELFALPRPRHKPVYYHSVLTELCKLVPQAVAPTFGRAIRSIYNNLETLEPEIAYRAWDWFSHHLSNFGFNWKWQEWIPFVAYPAKHPKFVFIRESIMKEAELSYNQRIKTTLPSEYHHIISDEAAGPNFQHNQPEDSFYAETTALLEALAGDAQSEKINELLSDIERKASDESSTDSHEAIIILTQAILQLGHQSFSHALNTIERHLEVLQSHCARDATTELITINAIFEFWSGRPFIASTLVQKLINYRILSPLSVMHWLFAHGDMSTSIYWELFDTTLEKTSKRVLQVQDRLTRMTADQSMPEQIAERNGTGQVKSEELVKLEKTWADVQAEQKQVFTETLQHLAKQVDKDPTSSEEENWDAYWANGVLKSFLRRHKDRLIATGDAALQDPRLERISGLKFA